MCSSRPTSSTAAWYNSIMTDERLLMSFSNVCSQPTDLRIRTASTGRVSMPRQNHNRLSPTLPTRGSAFPKTACAAVPRCESPRCASSSPLPVPLPKNFQWAAGQQSPVPGQDVWCKARPACGSPRLSWQETYYRICRRKHQIQPLPHLPLYLLRDVHSQRNARFILRHIQKSLVQRNGLDASVYS